MRDDDTAMRLNVCYLEICVARCISANKASGREPYLVKHIAASCVISRSEIVDLRNGLRTAFTAARFGQPLVLCYRIVYRQCHYCGIN